MKTQKILVFLILSIIMLSSGAIGLQLGSFKHLGAIIDPAEYPADVWYNETVLKTGYAASPESFISYDRIIIYSDEIIYQDDDFQPLKLDLILRSFDDVNLSETKQVYGTILNIEGNIPRYDLNKIRIETLEKYHGKLFVGIKANDPYFNINPYQYESLGTNDEYRRRVYVTSSVEEGHLISNPYFDTNLGGQQILSIDSIKPKPPHIVGSPGMQSPTSCSVQIRTAETEANLEFALWSENYEENTIITIPINHHYIQYKVNMSTEDISLSPIVSKIELLKLNGDVIFSDSSWNNPDSYQSSCGISNSLSKGELVLENLLIGPVEGFEETPQVHFSCLFQAPSAQEPPEWCYHVKQFFTGDYMVRNFVKDNWPYPGVVSMEVFKGKLYMSIGSFSASTHMMSAGEFASYDYESGLIKTEANQYSEQEFDWWSEGNGRLRTVGDLLVNNGIDTKSLGTDVVVDPEVPGGCQMYQFTDGSGNWYIGITPSAGIFGCHLWDITEYFGKLLISRNKGVYHKDMPTDFAGHSDSSSYNPSSWSLLNGTQHIEGDPDTLGNAVHRLMKFGNYLIVNHADNRVVNQTSIKTKVLYTFDQNLELKSVINTSSITYGADQNAFGFHAVITHHNRLIAWNARSGRIPDQGMGGVPGEGGITNESGINLLPFDPEAQQAHWASRLYYTEQLLLG